MLICMQCIFASAFAGFLVKSRVKQVINFHSNPGISIIPSAFLPQISKEVLPISTNFQVLPTQHQASRDPTNVTTSPVSSVIIPDFFPSSSFSFKTEALSNHMGIDPTTFKKWESWVNDDCIRLYQAVFIILHSHTRHNSASRIKTPKYDSFTPPWFPASITTSNQSFKFHMAEIPGLKEMRSKKEYKLAMRTIAALYCGDTSFFKPVISYVFTNADSIYCQKLQRSDNDCLPSRLLHPRKRRAGIKRAAPNSASTVNSTQQKSRVREKPPAVHKLRQVKLN